MTALFESESQASMIKAKRIEPIVFAVNNLDEAIPVYQRVFGARFGDKFTQTSARFAPFMLGNSYFELAEPTDPNGGVGRFLKSKGQGIWMITVQVEDIRQAIMETRRTGVRILLEEMLDGPQVAISGITWRNQMVFLHPSDTGRVLVILMESAEPAGETEPHHPSTGLVSVNGVERFSIAQESFEPLLSVFERLFGAQPSPVFLWEKEGYKYRYMDIGESSIEILVPTDSQSAVARFIASRGQGVYHITLRINELDSAIKNLKGAGLTVLGPTSYPPQPPFMSWNEVFLHPKHTFGVLFALAEIKKDR